MSALFSSVVIFYLQWVFCFKCFRGMLSTFLPCIPCLPEVSWGPGSLPPWCRGSLGWTPGWRVLPTNHKDKNIRREVCGQRRGRCPEPACSRPQPPGQSQWWRAGRRPVSSGREARCGGGQAALGAPDVGVRGTPAGPRLSGSPCVHARLTLSVYIAFLLVSASQSLSPLGSPS